VSSCPIPRRKDCPPLFFVLCPDIQENYAASGFFYNLVASMAKMFSIVLSALVFLQGVNMDMGDMMRLNELFEHAAYHYEHYGDNFLVFLSKHYGELEQEHKKAHQEEQQQHEKLPFNHHSCSHIIADFVLAGNFSTQIKSIPITDTLGNFFYQETYSSFEKFDIFQPPRGA
jgi:hypothetical protein